MTVSKRRRPEVTPTEEIKAVLPLVDAWVGPDGRMRFEMPNQPETRPLIKMLWDEESPSVTYSRGAVDLRYRFTVSANRWRKVFVAWRKVRPDDD